jgi:hypothetical protein
LTTQSVTEQALLLKEENEKLFAQAIVSSDSYETLTETIRKIALNLEQICVINNENEYISNICNRIIREFKSRGLEKQESTVYKALSDKRFSRFKNERYSAKQLESSSDLPEEVSIEMKEITKASLLLTKINWERFPNSFVTSTQTSMAEGVEKVESYQDDNNIMRYNKEFDPLEQNARSSPYHPKRPLIEPVQDETENAISKQYQYLVNDINSFVHNFLKRYYPPEEERKYYARSVWLIRRFFSQYESNKIHRDFKDWSEIYAADEGYLPSGKSAKEVSARYGSIVRRYDRNTGQEVFGRKSICKEQIQKKKPSLTNFMQQVYHLVPIFLFTHRIYQQGKEKIFVDHAIDIKGKRQHFA